MAKVAALNPRQSGDQFVINLPPGLSPTGKRQRRFFSSAKAASDFVEDLRKKEKAGLAVARRSSPDLIRQAVELDETFRDIFGFKGGLQEAATEFMRRLTAEQSAPTLGEMIEHWRKPREGDWADGTVGGWDWFEKQVEELAGRSMAIMDTKFWGGWLDERAQKCAWVPRTWNDAASKLSTLYNQAVALNRLPSNPLDALPRKKLRRVAKAVFTVGQVRELLNCAWEHDRELVPYFAVAVFAGLRPEDTESEIARMTWEDINWDERWIKVRSSKTEDTNPLRYVHIEDNLLAWLGPFRGRAGKVVPKNLVRRRRYLVRGKYQAPKGSLEKEWKELVPWGQHVRDITRHTYGSYLDAKYRDTKNAYEMICSNMGHTSIRTYQQHYRNTRTRQEGAEFWAIMPPQ